MTRALAAPWVLEGEARALLTRLAFVKPFALLTPMVAAARLSPAAETAIETHLRRGRRKLRSIVRAFLRWLEGPVGRRVKPEEAQRQFAFLRLRFNSLLSDFDIYADVLSQRSEHGTGVLISGLDALAADALSLPGYLDPPPTVCYLDRGHGAAIRRARTGLPGGDPNPVAIIRVPRERMVGSGIASSLIHEVGHQAAALLDLVTSLRTELRRIESEDPERSPAWRLYQRWMSEIVADFWSVARVGITSTHGLIGVVSLPRAFVFRVDLEDPHPIPWLRVKISCAMGNALYPHPQWEALSRLWESLYPRSGLDAERLRLLSLLEKALPRFVSIVVNHRPATLRGRSLKEVMDVRRRSPELLSRYFRAFRETPERVRSVPPSLVFAVIGQAKLAGEISPEEESVTVSRLLGFWALRDTLRASGLKAGVSVPQLRLPAVVG